MLDKDFLVPYLRKSLVLQSPEIETDPAYVFTDEDLYDILLISMYEHNPTYDETSFPRNEYPFLILLSKKEVYYRLATASAPFYPLQAEGASLRKDYRFEHYMSLVRMTNNEYLSKYEKFTRESPIIVGNLYTSSRHFDNHVYNTMNTPEVNLTADRVGDTFVEISWDKFSVIGGMFSEYQVYCSTEPIYDKYTDTLSISPLNTIFDIRRTYCRLTDLQPDTTYHIAVVSKDMNGVKGIMEIEVHTLKREG